MRIVCPECSAAYEVPDTLLAATRPVRCARCGHEWRPDAAAAEAAAEPRNAIGSGNGTGDASGEPPAAISVPAAAAAGPEAATAREQTPAGEPTSAAPGAGPSRARAATPAAWAGSAVLLVVLAWAAYTWRGPIMHAWPPSERVYMALGLA